MGQRNSNMGVCLAWGLADLRKDEAMDDDDLEAVISGCRMKWLTAVAMSLISLQVAAGTVLTGKVVGVSDGDTLWLLSNKTEHRIRLAGIDAPEKAQPFGKLSKQSLSDLVYGKTVKAICPDRDRYERLICRIDLDGKDINLEQIRRGMAWAYRQYSPPMAYLKSEEQARGNGTGLWADRSPIPPWEWRH